MYRPQQQEPRALFIWKADNHKIYSEITCIYFETDMSLNTNDMKDRKRKVCFDRRVSVHTIRSHRIYTEEEIGNIWFCREEYATIACTNKALIRMMHTGNLLNEDDTGLCYRGLVHESARKRRMEYRRQALDSLLREQQRQYMSGIFDDEKLRKAVLRCTEGAVQEAITRAEEDRRNALDQVPLIVQRQTKYAASQQPSLASALALNTDTLVAQPRQNTIIMSNKRDLTFLLDNALAVLEAPTC